MPGFQKEGNVPSVRRLLFFQKGEKFINGGCSILRKIGLFTVEVKRVINVVLYKGIIGVNDTVCFVGYVRQRIFVEWIYMDFNVLLMSVAGLIFIHKLLEIRY